MPLPKCVKIDYADGTSAVVLADEGWRDVGILEIWHGEVSGKIREAKSVDNLEGKMPFIDRIADFNFSGRLWRDEQIEREEAIEQTRSFMKNSKLFYAIEKNGFGIFTRRGEDLCIDLVGVLVHRKGHAQDIIRSAIAHLETDHLWAGTYSDNVPARRLYETLGMRTTCRYRVFHK